jgi:hypothetical protein
MSKWTDLATDLDEFEGWAKKVGDYHAQQAIYRFLRMKRLEAARIRASDKTKFIEEESDG